MIAEYVLYAVTYPGKYSTSKTDNRELTSHHFTHGVDVPLLLKLKIGMLGWMSMKVSTVATYNRQKI